MTGIQASALDAGMTRQGLIARWTERAAWLSRCGLPGAGIYRECIAEVERLWEDEDDQWVPAGTAAKMSGYSEDHLRRLARDGLVTAEKRRRAWWYRAGSLLKKGPRGAKLVAFDPEEAARRALARGSEEEMMEDPRMGGNSVDQEVA